MLRSTTIEISPHGSKGINFHGLKNNGVLLRTLGTLSFHCSLCNCDTISAVKGLYVSEKPTASNLKQNILP